MLQRLSYKVGESYCQGLEKYKQQTSVVTQTTNMNSPFGLARYLCWWNQQNGIYKQSFIVLLTGIILKCPCTSKPFWSQSRDIFLLLKNVFCDTAVIQKVAFQLQMEENSSRYGSKLSFIFTHLRLAWQYSLSSHGDAGRRGKAGKKEKNLKFCHV